MTLLTGIQILLKTLLVIILGSLGSLFPFYYLFGDVTVFLLYKVAMNDFTYWIPFYGLIGTAVALLIRVITKFIGKKKKMQNTPFVFGANILTRPIYPRFSLA